MRSAAPIRGGATPWSSLALLVALAAAIPLPAQRCSFVDARQGADDLLQPVDFAATSSIKISYCMTVPILGMALPDDLLRKAITALVATNVLYDAPDFRAQLQLDFTDAPDKALRAVCGLFRICPVPVVDFCGPQVVQRVDYGVMRGQLSANVRAAGGGFSGGASFTRIAEGTWCLSDRLQIDSPVAQTLELPVSIAGSILAAESFGDPNGTYGRAELSVQGTVFGRAIARRIAVESVTTIPEQASIQQVDTVTVTVPAGRSVHAFSLTARGKVEARAQSAGLFGTIVGAATVAVDAPNSVHIGRLRGAGNTALHPGTVVTGLDTGAIYEIVVPVPAPFVLLPGCALNGGILYPAAPGTPLGGSMSLALASSTIASGVTAVFLGAEALGSLGCGVVVTGFGELLLATAPPPVLLGNATVQQGRASMLVPIPNNPRLMGLGISLQGVSLGSGANPMLEVATGLRATLGN